MEELPLRLIDVEATIASSQRGAISFTRQQEWHIISHAWSIFTENLSRSVVSKVKASGQGYNYTYEELFQSADFSKEDSYREFVEFLKLLQSDGVRWVWFDALCINQTDVNEKNREIGQMGSFYERSLGCYVLQHGVGKGYRLLDDSETLMGLPRWFSRVWTFQEWILPTNITFILEDLDLDLHRAAQKIILGFNKGGSCCCCEHDSTIAEYVIEDCKKGLGFEPIPLDVVCSQVKSCKQGFHFKKVPGGKHGQYFTDDLGYLFLVRLIRALNTDYASLIDDPKEAMLRERLLLRTRLTKAQIMYKISQEMEMHLAIEEISKRFCTNEEDRVLSILKLLKVEGAVQVRTGKKLYEQLIYIVNDLVEKRKQEELLVRLCLVDGWGNERPGMSWAPTFKIKPNTRQEGIAKLAYRWIYDYMEGFVCEAKVRGVRTESGVLLLESWVIPGQLISHHHNATKAMSRIFRRWRNESSKEMVLQVDGYDVNMNLCALATDEAPHACILLPVLRGTGKQQGSLAITALDLHHRLLHQYVLDRVQVWLVQMGHGYVVGESEKSRTLLTYFVVCVGEEGGPLHKIGYVGLPSSTLVSKHQIVTRTTCSIGGLGDDLSAYIYHDNGNYEKENAHEMC